MHWIFQCVIGLCIGFIFGVSGVLPAYQGAPLTLGLIRVIFQLSLKHCETMIVNVYEGNVFGKINSPPSCSLFCSFSCQAFALSSISCLSSMFLVEMSC